MDFYYSLYTISNSVLPIAFPMIAYQLSLITMIITIMQTYNSFYNFIIRGNYLLNLWQSIIDFFAPFLINETYIKFKTDRKRNIDILNGNIKDSLIVCCGDYGRPVYIDFNDNGNEYIEFNYNTEKRNKILGPLYVEENFNLFLNDDFDCFYDNYKYGYDGS